MDPPILEFLQWQEFRPAMTPRSNSLLTIRKVLIAKHRIMRRDIGFGGFLKHHPPSYPVYKCPIQDQSHHTRPWHRWQNHPARRRPPHKTGMSFGNTARIALIPSAPMMLAGKILSPSAPALIAAKHSLGVSTPGHDPRPNSLVLAMTAISQLGDTMNSPFAALTRSTSSGVKTVPRPRSMPPRQLHPSSPQCF